LSRRFMDGTRLLSLNVKFLIELNNPSVQLTVSIILIVDLNVMRFAERKLRDKFKHSRLI